MTKQPLHRQFEMRGICISDFSSVITEVTEAFSDGKIPLFFSHSEDGFTHYFGWSDQIYVLVKEQTVAVPTIYRDADQDEHHLDKYITVKDFFKLRKRTSTLVYRFM